MGRKWKTLACTAAIGLASRVGAAVVTIPPMRDNTLFSNSSSVSCGAGPLFVGRTGSLGNRRPVLAFDVASAVPPGSTIQSVELTVFVNRSGPGAQSTDVHALHRLNSDWGEGASQCTSGQGAPAATGDATWDFRFFATALWIPPGGDFQPLASGSTAAPVSGPAVWSSSAGMVADVQSWLDDPAASFGWIMIGQEAVPSTARDCDSRDGATPPALRIDYTPPPIEPPAVPDGSAGSALELAKLSPDGGDLEIVWDTATCDGHPDHHVIYGTGASFPSVPGGIYGVAGSVCHVGASSPFHWTGVPDPGALDPSSPLLWILVVADDGAAKEGSWGVNGLSHERSGSGVNGSSDQCGIQDKSLSNSCGIGEIALAGSGSAP